MAKLMSFESEDGNVYPASYWIPVQINICKLNGTGRVVFYGFKDKACRDAQKLPIGQHAYEVTKEDYDDLFDQDAMQVEGATVYSASYELANNKDQFFSTASDG